MAGKRELKEEIKSLYNQAEKLIGRNKPYKFNKILEQIKVLNKKLDKKGA